MGSGANGPTTAVTYLGRGRVLVRGPATGRQYEFAPNGRAQFVDSRDAHALLSMRYFRRARL